MSARNGELQIIPIHKGASFRRETKSGKSYHNGAIRRKRRKKRLLRRLFACVFGICGVCLAALAITYLITNGIADLSPEMEKAEIEKVAKSEGYPEELLELLEQNDETTDFVKNYSNREKYQGKEIDLSEDFKSGSVPLLMQWDKRWGYDSYGEPMIGLAGCGPTCMTMAYLYYTEDTSMNPRKMAEFAQDRGYHSSEGTSWDFWTAGAAELGLNGETVSLSETAMQNVLDAGGLLVCSMSPGDFTTGGHYILIRGYDENGFFVNDPNRKSNSDKQWDFKTLSSQIKNLWGLYP